MDGKATHPIPGECFLWAGEEEKGIELGVVYTGLFACSCNMFFLLQGSNW